MPRRSLADAMMIVALAVAPATALVYVLTTTAPAILAGALVLPLSGAFLLVRREPAAARPWAVALAAILWGAVIAAFASSALNNAVLGWLADVAGEARALSLGPTLAAPVIEEVIKAAPLVLLLRLSGSDPVRAGILAGALVGLGFELTENVHYLTLAVLQGGPAGLARGVWVRSLVGGLDHAIFTASAGAGIGYGCVGGTPRCRVLAPALGLGAAIVQHVVWNALAAPGITRVLCNPSLASGACADAPDSLGLALEIPLIGAAALAPGVVALTTILRRRRAVARAASTC